MPNIERTLVNMDGRKHLGETFGAFVDAQGWTQSQIAAMGGPSTTSQTKIRTTDEPLSRQTLKKIDHVMGWEPGTAGRIASGRVTPRRQATITDYTNDELLAEVRRRMTGEGGSDADAKPEQKMTGPGDPATDGLPRVSVDPPHRIYGDTRADDPSGSQR